VAPTSTSSMGTAITPLKARFLNRDHFSRVLIEPKRHVWILLAEVRPQGCGPARPAFAGEVDRLTEPVDPSFGCVR